LVSQSRETCRYAHRTFLLGFPIGRLAPLTDSKGYDSDEFDATMRRIEAELAQKELEEKQAATKQVFVTNKGDDAGQRAADPPSQAA
jgi:hypothetical protein